MVVTLNTGVGTATGGKNRSIISRTTNQRSADHQLVNAKKLTVLTSTTSPSADHRLTNISDFSHAIEEQLQVRPMFTRVFSSNRCLKIPQRPNRLTIQEAIILKGIISSWCTDAGRKVSQLWTLKLCFNTNARILHKTRRSRCPLKKRVVIQHINRKVLTRQHLILTNRN